MQCPAARARGLASTFASTREAPFFGAVRVASVLPLAPLLGLLALGLVAASLSGCGGRHLSAPDLVLGVRYHRSVSAGVESLGAPPGGASPAVVRSAVTGLVALRMQGRAMDGAPPPRDRAWPSASAASAAPAAPCVSSRLCAWEMAAARRATRRLLGPSTRGAR